MDAIEVPRQQNPGGSDASDAAIEVRGARVHNLKNLDVRVPLGRLVALTGVSGSGKSTLAFDILFAEGQRRYLEGLSARTRQALSPLERPDVDSIEGLPATVCIDQRTGSVHPRSTLATLTEIAVFLRLLYARAGQAHCTNCGRPVSRQTPAQIVDRILAAGDRRKAMLLAPLVRHRKGEHREVFEKIVRDGFVRARVDGQLIDAADPPKLAKAKPHTIEVIVDRIVVKDGIRPRLTESVQAALRHGDGQCLISLEEDAGWTDLLFSEKFACPECGLSFPNLEPRTLSFNSPQGACPKCDGLGTFEPESGGDPQPCPECHGARLNAFARGVTFEGTAIHQLMAMTVDNAASLLSKKVAVSLHDAKPGAENAPEEPDGANAARRIDRASSASRAHRQESSAAHSDGIQSRGDRSTLAILERTVPDILARLRFLASVGLGYLTLDRAAPSLSGGELQRARLASSLGSDLSGVCYILDEPTAGLHPADTARLLDALLRLREQQNSVLVVEHDLDVIRRCDWVVDLGPGAGQDGGRLVAEGPPQIVAGNAESITGRYLAGPAATGGSNATASSGQNQSNADSWLTLTGARRHNLKDVTLRIPLGRLVCITGVSGSGKSSLIAQTLVPAVRDELQRANDRNERLAEKHVALLPHPGSKPQPGCESFTGVESLRRLVDVDQKPLGRGGRSTPATYTGVWDEVRKLFAKTKDARLRGFKSRRFSFTDAEGRCPVCRGNGLQQIRLDFVPPLQVICPSCRGGRFNRQTLTVRYAGKNVADVLALRIDEAAAFFANIARIYRPLKTLADVGLGYLALGQSSLTLSGGEAQRVKLAAELSRETHEPTLFVLDEPTTGLHPADVDRLIAVLRRLVDHGHTVLVVEHHLGLIAASDWVIDLGPGAGDAGGQIVAEGTPSTVAAMANSLTGAALREWVLNPP